MSAPAAAPVILLADLASRHRPVGAVGYGSHRVCKSCHTRYPCEVVRAIREGLVELDDDDPPTRAT